MGLFIYPTKEPVFFSIRMSLIHFAAQGIAQLLRGQGAAWRLGAAAKGWLKAVDGRVLSPATTKTPFWVSWEKNAPQVDPQL